MFQTRNIKDMNSEIPNDLSKAGDGARQIRNIKSNVQNIFPGIDLAVDADSDYINNIDKHIDFTSNQGKEIQLLNDNYNPGANERKTLEIDDQGEISLAYHLGALGEISMFQFDQAHMETIYPGRFLLCDGQGLPLSSQLAIAIGANIPENAINLPDMRGVVPRGHDPRIYADDYLSNDDSGKNPGDSALGDFQDDALADHTHTFPTTLAVGLNNNHNVPADDLEPIYWELTEQASGKADLEVRAKARILNFFMRVN